MYSHPFLLPRGKLRWKTSFYVWNRTEIYWFFRKCTNHFKIMAARRVTWNKFSTGGPQMLSATVQRFRWDLCSLKLGLSYSFWRQDPHFVKCGNFIKTLICHDSKIGRKNHVKHFFFKLTCHFSKDFFIFTKGWTIYLLRSTLKFILKFLLHFSV